MKKNMIKNVLAVSVVAAMAISCAACSETTETSAETEGTVVETAPAIELDGEIDEDLIGSWTMEEDGSVITYTFNDDNTGVVEMNVEEESVEFEIAYSADGETLTVVMVEMPDSEDTAEYTIDGDTLTLVTEGDQNMELTREA